MFRYRRLVAYQKAKRLIVVSFKLIDNFPAEEKYALGNQLRRALISITSNIAEGIYRKSAKEKKHFLEISYGSLMEVSSQFDIALSLGYITKEQLTLIDNIIEEEARILSGLQNSLNS